ncbi:MAG: hypothetical protein IPJ65_26830 [Archangiaceae bacterium]|nr:hypothetical protein [Archangiaceae bacterium]
MVPVVPLEDHVGGQVAGHNGGEHALHHVGEVLMGPQLVSPSARRPISISGSEEENRQQGEPGGEQRQRSHHP